MDCVGARSGRWVYDMPQSSLRKDLKSSRLAKPASCETLFSRTSTRDAVSDAHNRQPVAVDVVDRHAVFCEHSRNEHRAMAIQWLVLCAHNGDSLCLRAVLQAFNAARVCRLISWGSMVKRPSYTVDVGIRCVPQSGLRRRRAIVARRSRDVLTGRTCLPCS